MIPGFLHYITAFEAVTDSAEAAILTQRTYTAIAILASIAGAIAGARYPETVNNAWYTIISIADASESAPVLT